MGKRNYPTMLVGQTFTAVGISCLNHFAANKDAVEHGLTEGVHQMRVGIRRLRTAVSFFKQILPGPGTAKVKDNAERERDGATQRWTRRRSRNPGKSITTRACEPLPICSLPSVANTSNSMCRPTTRFTRAVAVTRLPTGVGARCYTSTCVPTALSRSSR